MTSVGLPTPTAGRIRCRIGSQRRLYQRQHRWRVFAPSPLVEVIRAVARGGGVEVPGRSSTSDASLEAPSHSSSSCSSMEAPSSRSTSGNSSSSSWEIAPLRRSGNMTCDGQQQQRGVGGLSCLQQHPHQPQQQRQLQQRLGVTGWVGNSGSGCY